MEKQRPRNNYWDFIHIESSVGSFFFAWLHVVKDYVTFIDINQNILYLCITEARQHLSSDQLLGNEEVLESFHLPEPDWQQHQRLDHGPPEHFAVGVFADLTESLLFLLRDIRQ